MPRPTLYLAAPLFSPSERAFNAALTERLERRFSVFLPQRDGKVFVDMLARGMSVQDAAECVYEADSDALRDCSGLVAVLDGAHVDEGVAFEVGFARALGKLCLGLQTDSRRLLPSGNNPLLEQALRQTFSSVDALAEFLATLRL